MVKQVDLLKEVRKTYKINDSDTFWPYMFEKARNEGIEEQFLNKIKVDGWTPFIGVLSYAMPPAYWTKDNSYYEDKAVSFFLLSILIIGGLLLGGLFSDTPFFYHLGFAFLFLLTLFLLFPTKFTSKYWEKIQYSDYLNFIQDKIKDKQEITDLEFQLFERSYGKEHTLYVIEQILQKDEGVFNIKSFLYYADNLCDHRWISSAYFWGQIKRNKENTPEEIKQQALDFYNRKINK